jgi:hypothetical protein
MIISGRKVGVLSALVLLGTCSVFATCSVDTRGLGNDRQGTAGASGSRGGNPSDAAGSAGTAGTTGGIGNVTGSAGVAGAHTGGAGAGGSGGMNEGGRGGGGTAGDNGEGGATAGMAGTTGAGVAGAGGTTGEGGGAGTRACGGCRPCFRCSTTGCEPEPDAFWDVICESAVIAPLKPNGAVWDSTSSMLPGTLPDAFCRLTIDGRSLSTMVVMDSLMPVWSASVAPVGAAITSSVLLSSGEGWRIAIIDQDNTSDEVCTVSPRITPLHLESGGLTLSADSCTQLSLAFVCASP